VRIKQTLLGVLVLGSALSAACGGDKSPGVVTPGNGGTNEGNGAGSTDEDGSTKPGPMDAGSETGGDASFPDDKTAPTLTFKQPSAAAGKVPIVGGTVQVIVSIKDEEAGVDARSLFATIKKSKSDIVRLEPTSSKTMGEFVFTFEAADFEERADLNMTVEVKDRAGNETVAPLLMQLDTKSPWVSLTPPALRFYSIVKGAVECSGPFDPVGASVEDGQVVEQEARFRAFVWDRAIARPGQEEFYHAGVNEGIVQLLVQDNAKSPLLTDSDDKDKICDAVDDSGAEAVRLDPVKSTGTAPFGAGTEGQDPADGTCVTYTKAPTTPIKDLCDETSDMSYVPTHDMPGGAAVVFAVAPTASSAGCTGTTWDSQTNAGWNCVVVRAWDKASPDGRGNLGFSKPIRVCRKLKETDCDGAQPGTILTPPASLTCTDGCTLPEEVVKWGRAYDDGSDYLLVDKP